MRFQPNMRTTPRMMRDFSQSPAVPTMAEENKPSQSLGMVYAKEQPFRNIYDPEIALMNGTIFRDLNFPFLKGACQRNDGEGNLQ